jgi:hypothetical protein
VHINIPKSNWNFDLKRALQHRKLVEEDEEIKEDGGD